MAEVTAFAELSRSPGTPSVVALCAEVDGLSIDVCISTAASKTTVVCLRIGQGSGWVTHNPETMEPRGPFLFQPRTQILEFLPAHPQHTFAPSAARFLR